MRRPPLVTISWTPGTIARSNYPLSDEDPVRCNFYTHPQTKILRRNFHYALEMGVLLRGRMEAWYQNHQHPLLPGDVWLTGIWEPHGGKITRAPCDVAVLFIQPQWLAGLRPPGETFGWLQPFSAAPDQRPWNPAPLRPRILALIKNAREQSAGNPLFAPAWTQILAQQILLLLLEHWRPRISPPPSRSHEQMTIHPAVELVFERKKPVNNQEAAQICRMNPGLFARTFRETMGMSFTEFGIRYRLKGAAGELRDTDQPVKSIAAEWGFAHASHLHRLFQRYFGCSPGEFRNRPHSDASRISPSQGV